MACGQRNVDLALGALGPEYFRESAALVNHGDGSPDRAALRFNSGIGVTPFHFVVRAPLIVSDLIFSPGLAQSTSLRAIVEV